MPTDAEFQAAATAAAQSDNTGRINVPEPAYRPPESAALLGLQEPKPAEEKPADADEQFRAAATDAYNKPDLWEWLGRQIMPGGEPVTPFDLQIAAAKRGITDIAGMIGGATQAVTAGVNLLTPQAPELEGKPVDQVAGLRDQMVKDKAEIDERINTLINSGSPDEGMLYSLQQQANSYDARIKQADGIVASGKPSTIPSETTEPLLKALRAFGSEAQPQTERFLDRLFPTNQEFNQSVLGQALTGGTDLGVLAASAAVGGPVGATVAMSTQLGNQTYQELKANGASDQDAERASGIVTLATGATMTVAGPTIGFLSDSFAGMTPKEGMAQIIRLTSNAVGKGTEFALLPFEQNAVSRLSGYDPNRPLDKDTWFNFFLGAGLGTLHTMIQESPRLSSLPKPDVEVRNKAGTAEETGAVKEEQTAAPEVTEGAAAPGAEAQPPPPVTEPAAQAQAAVPTAGATPEQVIAQQGAPEDELAKFNQTVQSIVQQAAPAAEAAARPEAAAPTAEARPQTPALPAPGPLGQEIAEAFARGEIGQDQHDRLQSYAETDPGMAAQQLMRASGQFTPAAAEAILREAETRGQYVSAERGVPTGYAGEPRGVDDPQTGTRYYEQSDGTLAMDKPADQGLGWWNDSPSARIPLPAAEPEDRPVGQADVKREVNDAQAQMGMEDHLLYVPNAEALPAYVRDGLTVGERNNTAQIVRDNKTGDTFVIGDRFASLQDLRRAIIEETLPFTYRGVTDLQMEHNAFNPDLGRYDPISDRPTLNTHAILRSDNPYREASRTAMEEVNVHQGISRLLGPRNGQRYVDAMNSVQANFDRLGLNDVLAQKKGYKNAEEMAAAYNVPDWRTNPRSAHKMTEELAGAYSRTFKNPAELAANGPSWWQNGLRNINNGIRQFLGQKLAPYDVQSLLADSAAALRRPKYGEPGVFHPEVVDNAKRDMAAFQYANRPPEVSEGPAGAAGAGERADIGSEIVGARAAELARGLQPGQFVRQQSLKLAMQGTRSFEERMGMLNSRTAITDHESHIDVMQGAEEIFARDFGGNPTRAMADITHWARDVGAVNPALIEVTNRAAGRQIGELRRSGFSGQADLLAAKLDRFNSDTAERVTGVARELSAQRLRHMDGSVGTTEFKRKVGDEQDYQFSKRENRTANDAATKGLDEVKQATKEAADSLRGKTESGVKAVAGATYRFSTTRSLPEQYTNELVTKIDDALHKTNSGAPIERPPVEDVYDTFRKNIQQIIRERVPVEPTEKAAPPSPTSTLRDIMTNYPAYREAWSRTMDMLYNKDPNLYQAFNRAIEEPVGEGLANRLAMEHGQNLSDLIYNHFSSVDRISQDLASEIARATGIRGDLADSLANNLQGIFKRIVGEEQTSKLQSILDNVGGTRTPPKGELDRLVDHVALGSLDSKEWLNSVAPRFGLTHYTPEQINALRIAGDNMSKMRDEGLANSVIAQKIRQDITNLTKLEGESGAGDALRYAQDVYSASLLTGPLTHLPYWMQNFFLGAWDSTVRDLQTAVKTGDPEIFRRQMGMALQGYARGASEFPGILKYGYRPAEGFVSDVGVPFARPAEGGKFSRASPMEQTKFSWQNPGTWFSRYKYVRNFLEGVSNLMLRGPEYAMLEANAMSAVWDKGLRGQEAWDAVSQVVLGSKDVQEQATREAEKMARDFKLDESQTTLLRNEILDRLKTTSDVPAGSETELGTKELRELATRARTGALATTLRGEVPGIAGAASRALIDLTNKAPLLRFVVPFQKVPFKLISEMLSWSPAGLWRSVPDLVPAWRQLPGIGKFGGIERYLGASDPEIMAKIKSGEISQEQMRDMAWNQFSKGLPATVTLVGLFSYMRSQIGNPNPDVRFTYQGPSNFGQQEIERGKGWQPHSIKLGNWGWFNYDNTPLRPVLSFLGAYEDYLRYEKQDSNAVTNEGQAFIQAGLGSVSSLFGSPLQGLDTVMTALTHMRGPDIQRTLGNFATQMAGSALSIPFGGTGPRQLARAIHPTEYEANTLIGKSLRYIPVVNDWLLNPKLNVFGEQMSSTPLKNFPFFPSVIPSAEADPVWNYLAEHPNIRLTMPGNSATLGKVKMTPEEIYVYHEARGPVLKQELAHTFARPGFGDLDSDRQNQIVKRLEAEASTVGKMAVMRYRREHPLPAAPLPAATP